MNTAALKLTIVQQIISITDVQVLEKIKELLEPDAIVGYRTDKTPITSTEFNAEMDEQQDRINNGKSKFYSSTEIREKIIHENNLGR